MSDASASVDGLGYKPLLLRRRELWRNRARLTDPKILEEFSTLVRINKKVEAYEWVRKLGHATVAYQVYPSIDAALRENRLSRFVIKPAKGRSSKGVHLLTRDEVGGYSCTMTSQHFENDKALVSHFAEEQRQSLGQISEAVILEEFLEDSLGFDIPLDYKVYAFAAGTPFVMQRYAPAHLPHDDWGFEFYDEHGRQLGPIRHKVSSGAKWDMRPPHNLAEVFQVAKNIVKEAQVSFIRIDLYSTPKGIVFGEFTPVPNNASESYTEEYDRILGDIWLRSLETLGLNYFDGTQGQPAGYVLKQRNVLLKKQQTLRSERDSLLIRNKQLLASEEATLKQLQAVLNSTTWRLTAPLRAGVSALRRLRGS